MHYWLETALQYLTTLGHYQMLAGVTDIELICPRSSRIVALTAPFVMGACVSVESRVAKCF